MRKRSVPQSLFARAFARIGPVMDRRGAAAHRRRLVADASGTVLEIGAGYGATFAGYPETVTRVTALEPDPRLRRIAHGAAASSGRPITVVDGVADRLPEPDASVDTVVVSLVLCSVPDQATALREIRRVLRPGGALLYYEHVRSAVAPVAAVEDLLTPCWAFAAGGCHPNRDTETAIRRAGFTIRSTERFPFSVLPGAPPVAHVLGSAERI